MDILAAANNTFLRCQELEVELQKLKAEMEILRNRSGISSDGAAPMTSSVAKVVQPTATVSSVPVSGPSKNIIFYNDCKTLISLLLQQQE